MKHLLTKSLAELAEPVRGASVLLWGFSGRGFPGGDGVAEAIRVLPAAGINATYTNEIDPHLGDKLAQRYDVSIVCNTRVGAVLKYDPRVWTCARNSVYWFWDLRPGGVAKPLAGKPTHVFLSYNGEWTAPNGARFSPQQWREHLGCWVGYCPQGAPTRTPVRTAHGDRVVFVGDLSNGTYHRGRREIADAVGARVVNARQRPQRLAIEAKMPTLYRGARYCLSMSPLAPGYTSVRTYSILACGGLMALHRFPGAERIFTDGENAMLFDDVDELRSRLRELDDDEPERERIADNGRRLHSTRHTVAHRVVDICRQVSGGAQATPERA
jgi:hypothetical protein